MNSRSGKAGQFRSGGRAFGPTPRSHEHVMPVFENLQLRHLHPALRVHGIEIPTEGEGMDEQDPRPKFRRFVAVAHIEQFDRVYHRHWMAVSSQAGLELKLATGVAEPTRFNVLANSNWISESSCNGCDRSSVQLRMNVSMACRYCPR